MGDRVPVSDTTYADVVVTLNGVKYTLTYRYNTRDARWHMDMRDLDGNYIARGLKLMGGTTPTLHLASIDFREGTLAVVQPNSDDMPCTRSNFGVGKNYELYYVTFNELEDT